MAFQYWHLSCNSQGVLNEIVIQSEILNRTHINLKDTYYEKH